MKETIATGIVWYIVFLLSTTMHEAFHALAAHRLGDTTAHRGGFTTFNPLPHIQRSLFGMVIVPLITFFSGGFMIGWASVPYDGNWAARFPKKAALMALAGPTANFILMIFALAVIHLGIYFNIFTQPDSVNFSSVVIGSENFAGSVGPAKVFSILFTLNLLLFSFNIMPVGPLDGAAIVPLFLSENVMQKYLNFIRQPLVQMGGFFLIWYYFGNIFHEIFTFALNTILYPGSYYG